MAEGIVATPRCLARTERTQARGLAGFALLRASSARRRADRREGAFVNPDRESRTRWVFLGFLAVAAFFLLSEHRAHFLGALPYLLLLACPLMHLFHHRGHHAHGGRPGEQPDPRQGERP